MNTVEEMPIEWRDTLDDLYNRYSDNPSAEQKINILKASIGDWNVSYTGEWRDLPEEREAVKLNYLELEYLEQIGCYKPSFY